MGLTSMKAGWSRPRPSSSRRKSGANRTPVIVVKPGLIITFRESATLEADAAGLRPDLGADIIKVAVIERHGMNGNIGRGFVKGFGIKRGAIASSVAHDSHNIAVVGVYDADMALAVNRVIAMGGGFAVADEAGSALNWRCLSPA